MSMQVFHNTLRQPASKPNMVEAMDDGDMELVDMVVFEPWACIRNSVCEWTHSGPSDARLLAEVRTGLFLQRLQRPRAPHSHRPRTFGGTADSHTPRGHEQTLGLQTGRRVQALALFVLDGMDTLCACGLPELPVRKNRNFAQDCLQQAPPRDVATGPVVGWLSEHFKDDRRCAVGRGASDERQVPRTPMLGLRVCLCVYV